MYIVIHVYSADAINMGYVSSNKKVILFHKFAYHKAKTIAEL